MRTVMRVVIGLVGLLNIGSEELKGTPGVVRARTTIVLRTTKETTVVPLPPDLDPK